MPNVPLLTGEHVRAAVSPSEAVDVVRDAFLAYARGDWTMPPKTYVEAYPRATSGPCRRSAAATRC